MYIESCSSEYLFDKIGNLTNEGKAEYWNEVNKLVEKFDCRKIKLLPKVDEREKRQYFERKYRQDQGSKASHHKYSR